MKPSDLAPTSTRISDDEMLTMILSRGFARLERLKFEVVDKISHG